MSTFYYYINNRKYTDNNEFDVFNLHRDENCKDGIGPAYFDEDHIHKVVIWFNHGSRHSLIGPAVYSNINNIARQMYCINDVPYYDFYHIELLNLQIIVRNMYFNRTTKTIWSPKEIAGIFTKKQLFNLLH